MSVATSSYFLIKVSRAIYNRVNLLTSCARVRRRKRVADITCPFTDSLCCLLMSAVYPPVNLVFLVPHVHGRNYGL